MDAVTNVTAKDPYYFFVTPAIIAKADTPLRCTLLDTYYDGDEDLTNPLDHKVMYMVPDKHERMRPRKVYVEPDHLFKSQHAANEYIADQIAKRIRALTRHQSRRLRPLRELTESYSKKKQPLKTLLKKAEARMACPAKASEPIVNEPARSAATPRDIAIQNVRTALFTQPTQQAA